MSQLNYRPARASQPLDGNALSDMVIEQPIPIPDDHPELDLWGLQRGGDIQEGIASYPDERRTVRHSIPSGDREREAQLPSRMLNEFVYCQRLFYYEHVEGVFVGNEDTERGSALHARVDRGIGALPESKSSRRTTKGKVQAAENGEAQPQDDGEGMVEETIHSRSVMLGSERLGVIAKMDLIEAQVASDGGHENGSSVEPRRLEVLRVTPVDYKAGAPRQGQDDLELWDTDKMQLGLQILILRDNGYACDEGVIYYRATKQRVPLEMTPELEEWIHQKIAEAREVSASPNIPPPLEDSPKCVRCSLAPVCLPDETRWLSLQQAGQPLNLRRDEVARVSVDTLKPPRRIIAARDDERALYLNTQGARVGIRSERLVVKDGDSVLNEVRLNDVGQVSLFGNIQCSTQAIQQLCEHEIPVAYFSMGGWFYGLTRGHGLKNVHTRIHQFAAASNPVRCLEVARKFVHAKIRNQRTMLMRLHIQPPTDAVVGLKEIAARVPYARGFDELLGMEGAAAAWYFRNFSGMIKVGDDPDEDEIPGLESSFDSECENRNKLAGEVFTFDFTRRRRRPPTDPVNALLSLAYSLLAKDCTIAALAVGFDPYVGFYHQPRHGRPALALDLMEEFRPLVAESAVLTAINNRMIHTGHFVRAGEAVNLTPQGRRTFFHAYEQRMNALITHPVFDYKVSYRRVLELQARLLARWLTGEISQYVPMTTR